MDALTDRPTQTGWQFNQAPEERGILTVLHRNDDAETLTTVTLLTELLLALIERRSAFKHLLSLGLDELGLETVDELTRDFPVPLLSEAEADRMVAWNWGCLDPQGGARRKDHSDG